MKKGASGSFVAVSGLLMGRIFDATFVLRDVSRKSTTARIWAAVPWVKTGTSALGLELDFAGACLAAKSGAMNVEAAATIAIFSTSSSDRILCLSRVGRSGADRAERLLATDG